ncbi:uncharacterized protein H6S33_011470 [Morchella sextelata]|uniref:uncharacterized protein n=1 Tax=Morchella sextelata TaxID=1174677 RepID=UPI001D04BBA7|nr:uncharacterized protein H6S33_011470 [Morchella sextelata]KAH0611043.1 hypothetical protein H6S33_011470 [Morchella sextelata]
MPERQLKRQVESKKTEAPYNYLMFKDAGDLQSVFLEGIDRPGFGDNLPALPVPPIEPLPKITVDPREPTEDEERKMFKAATMAKYMYLSRAYVFEYQKMFPLMHQRNLEDHGENYGLMECMELYRYAVKKYAANIPEFLPGLISPE